MRRQAETTAEPARDRILRVAAELFAEGGFRNTSVRAICDRSGVNVSMVNYYFDSKADLYCAALEYARQQEIRSGPPIEGELTAARARTLLREWFEGFLQNLLLPGPSSYLTKLITRELRDPSAGIEVIIAEDVRPQHEYLGRIVRAIAPRDLTDEEVQRCVFSIVGQALFYASNRPINELIAPRVKYDEGGIRETAEHLAKFTAAGLRFPP